FEAFTGKPEDAVTGMNVSEFFNLPEPIRRGIENRFKNLPSPRVSADGKTRDGRKIRISLSTFMQRSNTPQTLRLLVMEAADLNQGKGVLVISRDGKPDASLSGPEYESLWNSIKVEDQEALIRQAKNRFLGPVDSMMLNISGRPFRIEMEKEEVRFPYPPVSGHPMGIDGAGRDVMARILYGLRTSLTFGLFLVVCSMAFGIAAGAVQGYFGGAVDISAQRFIEIWSALPFLYVMILMGSTYGRSFSILLFCYGIFNWIGISYYIRAEFLRLRTQGFVEAAKCLGLSSGKIIFRHILPNALIPVITFFPFSLVGAIGALAALDYLGFGLPPPTPSWGELLFQAQQYRWAWWLILYPSAALFVVMLLGVFVGEGIRNAYDPRQYTRLE
ncbi:MAG: ABC transporter permease subunit, partial [Thermodesulfobacteriota bacterium]